VVEDLEKVLEDLEKIKELRIQVNRQSSILDRLWLTVFPNNELLNKQLEAQKE
jgi:hypothetical protein